MPEPPASLFLTGRVPVGPRVAIVGTRRPTLEAAQFAEDLAADLAHAGVVVVSGGALGIDTAAHRGALGAGMGTLVVAPASYCCAYPEQNRQLFAAIVEGGGGYLTPHGPGTPARRHAFFARNGLLISLCSTVVLVQAPFRSGARNALLWARRLKRTIWVVPHSPWCGRSTACVAELRLGGLPLGRAKDVLQWLSQRQLHAVPPRQPPSREPPQERLQRPLGQEVFASSCGERAEVPPRSSPGVAGREGGEPEQDETLLVRHLRTAPAAGPVHPDELCQRLGWRAARLQAAVLRATLLGDVQRTPTGHVMSAAAPKGKA